MPERPFLLCLLLLVLTAMPARASDPCPLLRSQVGAANPADRVAALACQEHQFWNRPFIDVDGRLAGSVVREGESSLLANGEQAWRRVARYWRESGLLPRVAGRAGATACGYAGQPRPPSPECRAFIIDTPWSAAFVSWVMRSAGMPGFRYSSSHVDYVRDAWRSPDTSAYRMLAPESERPRRGDLLCYARESAHIFGHAGLVALLDAGSEGVGMHCDIVVGVQPRDGLAYLVVGNVFDGVTMRLLPVDADGRLAGLPLRTADDAPCSPDLPEACSANRQDWVALMQLKPPRMLAGLAPPQPLPAAAPTAPARSMPPQPPGTPAGCCVYCVAGGDVPRCPKEAPPQRR